MAKTTKHHPVLSNAIETVAQYVHDPTTITAGDATVKNWNTFLGVANAIDRRAMLLMGNPGSGKTTFSNVVNSVVFGLPYDLFDICKVQGHPDHTKDTLIGRIDLANIKDELVVWQNHLYLPGVVLDEVNRLQPGKQGTILEYVRTGVASHLNRTFLGEKPAFFATMNFNGPGTYPLTQAFLDRFDISVELGNISAVEYEEIDEKSARIKQLMDRRRTETIVELLADKTVKVKDKLQKMAIEGEHGMHAKLQEAVSQAQKIPFNVSAKSQLCSIIDEMNRTFLYGTNRAGESADTSPHNKDTASANIEEGTGVRAHRSIAYFSRMLALYLNEPDPKTKELEVTPHHIFAVAPYVLAHRLKFTEEFKAPFMDDTRDVYFAQYLTVKMLEKIKQNYSDNEPGIALMDLYLSGKATKEQVKQAEAALKAPRPDHPVLRAYWEHFQE
jgi:MoxR-like ATPase